MTGLVIISRRPAVFSDMPRLNQNAPLAAGLVGWWPNPGNGRDCSIYGNNGSAVNAPTQTYSPLGPATTFNGTSQYIDVPNAPWLNPTALTMSAWIYQTAGHNGDFINKGDNSGYRVRTNSTLQIEAFISGGTHDVATASSVYSLNQWLHVAVTVDTTGIKIYINGVQRAAGGGATVPTTTSDLQIGASTTFTEYYQGSLADVRIYSRGLSAAEVLSLYNEPISIVRPTKRYAGFAQTLTPTATIAATTQSPTAAASLTAYAGPQMAIAATLARPTASASLQEEAITLTASAVAPTVQPGSFNTGHGVTPPVITMTFTAVRQITIASTLPNPVPSITVGVNQRNVSINATIFGLPTAQAQVTYYQPWKVSTTVPMPTAAVSLFEQAYFPVVQATAPAPNVTASLLEVILPIGKATTANPSATASLTTYPTGPEIKATTLAPIAAVRLHYQAPVTLTAKATTPAPKPSMVLQEEIVEITANAIAPGPLPGREYIIVNGRGMWTPPIITLSYTKPDGISVAATMKMPSASVVMGGGAITIKAPLTPSSPIVSVVVRQVATASGVAVTVMPTAAVLASQGPTAGISVATIAPSGAVTLTENVPIVSSGEAALALPSAMVVMGQDAFMNIAVGLDAPTGSVDAVTILTPTLTISAELLSPTATPAMIGNYISIGGTLGVPLATTLASTTPLLKRGSPVTVFAMPQVIDLVYPRRTK